jgi:TPR repeat protein
MLELDGPQLKVLRTGLLSAFVGPDAFNIFLRDELDKRLNFYAGGEDPFPVAAFKLVDGAQAEGWIDELVTKAYQARPKNRNIADIAKILGISVDAGNLEPAGPVHLEPPLWQSLINPYRGLLALREQDASFLFGRDEDIARFITTLAKNPSKLFLALGASGVGKSSLVFAGVFAALKRQSLRGGTPWPAQLSQSRTWPRLTLTPGPEPLRSLAGAFLRKWLDPLKAEFREEANRWRKLLFEGDSLDGLIEALDASRLKEKGDKPSRYLLYIDQGEELYTRGGREPNQDGTQKEAQAQKEARRFSDLVADAAHHPRLVTIMSARSDFLGRLQADAPLHAVKQQIDIAPLSPEGLSEVVRRPAAQLNVAFEPGLDEALIANTREQVGGLPLLSDTLDILWKEMQERGDGILRWSRPLSEGVDVAMKLGERADGFVKAHHEQEALVRRLFCVRLASVPVQGAATRRTALLEELTDPERALVAELAGADQRIVVTGEHEGKPAAEVAHEALFTAWQSLRNWIAARRAFYAWVTQNETERKDWEKQSQADIALLTGRPLERAKSFLETDGQDIPGKDRAFIEASIKADNDARERAQKRDRRRLIGALLGAAVAVILAVIAVIAGLFATKQRTVADDILGAATDIIASVQHQLDDETKRRVFDVFTSGARNGNTTAMSNLGWSYLNGWGVGKDYGKARGWCEKAAAGGNAGGMINLGRLYENGWGVEKDYGKAREWYGKAAAGGDARGMANLGVLYEDGLGVEKDYGKAREWYEKAAAGGDAAGMIYLGRLYENGWGVEKDYGKAREWYEKAAAGGNATGMANLEMLAINEAHDDGRYAEALHLAETLAKRTEAAETKSNGSPGEQTAEALKNVSWAALFAREFREALDAATRGHALAPDNLAILTNAAHAHMFLGHCSEAKAIYLTHKGQRIGGADGELWEVVILDDFHQLRRAELSNPLMAEIEKEFGPGKSGDGSIKDEARQ